MDGSKKQDSDLHSLAETAAALKAQEGPGQGEREGFMALSRFVIANGMMEEVKNAFRNRPHQVDSVVGFVRMDVLTPFDQPEEVWLLTYWTNEECYRLWHRSHQYHESHRGIPRGLKLVPGSAEIRLFEFICA
ncbi:MAG: antibiotic biosynthesis monooxygenase [Armatimonadota bacterium]|nr:antibiotic biosynthesis monooxygenase [Armatimonadota bacterium]